MRILVVLLGFILTSLLVFSPVVTSGKVPIPSDALVGLYHPFRDFYSEAFPRGMPFKNFLITDPVRQQYPFRNLSIEEIKNRELPLWNPYNFGGTPLLANLQSAPFYPLNIFYFLLPFSFAWTLQVFLQPVMAGIFTYLYLRRLGASEIAGFFGGIAYCLSGFSVAWMEWNTVIHAALWLPLILLSIEHLVEKLSYKWGFVFMFSLVVQFFAGHLQTSFYLVVLSATYLLAKVITSQKGKSFLPKAVAILKKLIPFACMFMGLVLLTFIQWFPTFKFIGFSARGVDSATWQEEGWFIPYQHLIQFIAPDFFGNPTTLNYWGTWNYGELVGYIGLVPLIMAVFAMVAVKRRVVWFFMSAVVLSLIMALQNPLSELPFSLSIPFLSTSQPTRLLFIVDFSLAVLAGLGLNYFQKSQKRFVFPLLFVGSIFVVVYSVVYSNAFINISLENIAVVKRNLILPTAIFLTAFFGWVLSMFIKSKKYILVLSLLLVVLTIFDLTRFAQKFLPFTDQEYLYPTTTALEYLQKREGIFRVMSNDDRILPPSTSIMYGLQTIEGYDPLYLRRFGELIAAYERDEPNISPPFGFNRIITPERTDSRIVDFMGVRYILSLSEIDSRDLKLVFEEGETKIYENQNAFPRAFSVETLLPVSSKEEAINLLFKNQENLDSIAVVEGYSGRTNFEEAAVEIDSYTPNRVIIKTQSENESFVVLADSYYPTWKARIVGGNDLPIFLTNYNFRGIILPPGQHVVEFYNTLL